MPPASLPAFFAASSQAIPLGPKAEANFLVKATNLLGQDFSSLPN